MTYNATFFRKKPRKPDFEHKGEKFWVSQCDRYEMWDGEYTPPLVIFIALYFDTDKEVDPKKETTLFLNKVYEKGNKLFPNVSKLESFNRS
jgi:hypothetical protein